jgi:peptide/nickel transport system substrate-binding protein
LIYRDPRTGELVGLLATAWRWVDDRTLELDLRRGVTFHDGSAFDAADVVFTLNYVADPKSQSAVSAIARWIDKAEKIDTYTARLRFKQPFPAALEFLASQRHVIHPSEYYERVGPKGMNAKPVGSGPWRVIEHAIGKYIRLERNPNYFQGGPKSAATLDTVEIRYIPDAQTRVAEVVAGGLDVITDVVRDQAEQLRDRPGLRILSSESVRYAFLQINSLPQSPAPQLRDIRVRQAILHAIDRASMVEHLVGAQSRVLHTECLPQQFGCTDEGVRHYAYDPARARTLLSEAGLGDGFDLDLYAFRERNQTEALIGYLAAVGIRARLRFMESAAITSARRAGRVALLDTVNGGGGVYDLSYSLSDFYTFTLDDTTRDPEIRDLMLRGGSSMDPNARKDAYAAAFRLIAERAYTLPLYSLTSYYVANADLVFEPLDDDILRFWAMSYR